MSGSDARRLLLRLAAHAGLGLAGAVLALAFRIRDPDPGRIVALYFPWILLTVGVRACCSLPGSPYDMVVLPRRRDDWVPVVRRVLLGSVVILVISILGRVVVPDPSATLPRTYFVLEPLAYLTAWFAALTMRDAVKGWVGTSGVDGVERVEWRLGYRPALDGVRGVAIVLVVLAHAGLLRNAGGIGVNIFFVLSGFLITTLLLVESARTGRVDLIAFYRRRAARLFPALLLVCGALTIYFAIVGRFDLIAPDVGGALSYVGNWLQIAGIRMLYTEHTWSLAVEEQFYLVWPFLFLALIRLRRSVLAVVLLLVAAVVWVIVLQQGLGATAPRTSRGTDIAAVALLAGCTLAFWLHHRPESTVGRLGTMIGLAFIVVPVIGLAIGWALPYAVVVTSIGTVPVIAGTYRSQRGPLTWAPLRYAGRISYGWYLWHFVIFSILQANVLTEIVVSILVSMASFHFFELPILRRFGRSRPKGGEVATTAIAPVPARRLAAAPDRDVV